MEDEFNLLSDKTTEISVKLDRNTHFFGIKPSCTDLVPVPCINIVKRTSTALMHALHVFILFE
jgi:hypothetical protein